MSRRKGSDKTGGRVKGTPNKVTTDLKTWVCKILDNGRDVFEKDLKTLEAAERVKVYINLLNYVLPKRQAVGVETEIEAEYKALSQLLKDTPDDFVNKVAEKIIKLKNRQNDETRTR
ncbi:hypothetical protein DMB45_05735 [Sanguibacteroides justesenii]|uniref:hypothetical protein n=1 Tax=Sanguibacteroides justesenii TaxID=1547597 RepID=UPI000D86960A|nr:hypothetical protein [Sanguibacteroides justesenii]PXZ44162.1 hypothetical protein DMB45_05735 [Sanguibacteroides justesenii]